MGKPNGWITEFVLIIVVISFFLQIGHLLAHAKGNEASKAVFYVH
jgi:hypothetical protein